MGHNISVIILRGDYNNVKAKNFDLIGIKLEFGLTMFHINHYYSACWQAKLNTKGFLNINKVDYILYPSEYAICELMVQITKTIDPFFAIISTDYHGGIGGQFANVYKRDILVNPHIKSINQALSNLGVIKKNGLDEFDSIGLSRHRSMPDYLDKYFDLADELGV